MALNNYQMYRGTTLGVALTRTLDDFVEQDLIPPALANRVLVQFDKAINKALSYRGKTKVQFKAEKLVTYRYCDNVWTFVMKNVEFRDINRSFDDAIGRVKIVACDGRATATANSAGNR